jgi:hypothetical protein
VAIVWLKTKKYSCWSKPRYEASESTLARLAVFFFPHYCFRDCKMVQNGKTFCGLGRYALGSVYFVMKVSFSSMLYSFFFFCSMLALASSRPYHNMKLLTNNALHFFHGVGIMNSVQPLFPVPSLRFNAHKFPFCENHRGWGTHRPSPGLSPGYIQLTYTSMDRFISHGYIVGLVSVVMADIAPAREEAQGGFHSIYNGSSQNMI